MNFGKHSLKYGGRLRATTDSNVTNANFNSEYSFGKRTAAGLRADDGGQRRNHAAGGLSDHSPKGKQRGSPFAAIQAMGGGASFYTLAVNPAGKRRQTLRTLMVRCSCRTIGKLDRTSR